MSAFSGRVAARLDDVAHQLGENLISSRFISDPDERTLLQVKVGDVAEADEIFAKLMGDVVEPRREFIQENALNVSNLDV